MAKPTVLPRFASGVGAGVVEPSGGEKDSGWLPAGVPPAEKFNWLHLNTYLWCQYVDAFEAHAHTWTAANTWSGTQLFTTKATFTVDSDSAIAVTTTDNSTPAVNVTSGGDDSAAVFGQYTGTGDNGYGVHGKATVDGIGVFGEGSGAGTKGGAFTAAGTGSIALYVTSGAGADSALTIADLLPPSGGGGATGAKIHGGDTATGTAGGNAAGGAAYFHGGRAMSNGDYCLYAVYMNGGEGFGGVTLADGGGGLYVQGGSGVGATSLGGNGVYAVGGWGGQNGTGGTGITGQGGDMPSGTIGEAGIGVRGIGGAQQGTGPGGVGGYFEAGASNDVGLGSVAPAIHAVGRVDLFDNAVPADGGYGHIRFKSLNPAPNSNDVLPNSLTAANIVKAHATVALSGGAPTLLDGFNVSSLSVVTYNALKHVRVNFVNGFAVTPGGTVTGWFNPQATPAVDTNFALPRITNVQPTYVDVMMYDAASAAVAADYGGTKPYWFHLSVNGTQSI